MVSGIRGAWHRAAAGLMVAVAVSYMVIAFLMGVPGPIGERTTMATRPVIHPLLDQSWRLFAPTLQKGNLQLLVRAEYSDGARTGTTSYVSILETLLALSKARRWTPSRLHYVEQEHARELASLMGASALVYEFRREHPEKPVPPEVLETVKRRAEIAKELLVPYISSAAPRILASTLPDAARIKRLRAALAISASPAPGEARGDAVAGVVYDTGWFHPDGRIRRIR